MFEFFVSVSGIFCLFFIVIDKLYRPADTGCIVSAFGKVMKCLTSISTESKTTPNDYKQFAIKWIFIPITLVGFVWNIVECILLYKEEENKEECLSSTFILSISSLSLLFVYLFISFCLICCTDIILNIKVHKALLLTYHILDTLADIAMLTATCKCTKVEQGLNSSYVIVIYSLFDVIQSGIHFVIMVFVLCFLLFKCTRPIKIYSEQG